MAATAEAVESAEAHAARSSRTRSTGMRERSGGRASWAAVGLPAFVLTVLAIARFATGKAGLDLAIFDQALWRLSRGDSPASTLVGDSLLGDHFSPGVLLFAALYRVVATPVWLLVAQGIATAAACAQVCARVEGSLGRFRTALLGAALVVSPAVASAVLFEFHPVTIAVAFGLSAIFAIEDDRPGRGLLWGTLASVFRIEIGIAVLCALLVWPGALRKRARGAAFLGAYLLVALFLDASLGAADYWSVHYGHLGGSAVAALGDPGRVLAHLADPSTLHVALLWLAGGGMLALARPRLALPALVVALPLLLSSWGPVHSLNYHYWAAPTLLLACAWIPVVRARRELATAVVVANVALAALYGPLTPALEQPLSGLPMPPSRAAQAAEPDSEIACLIRGIPSDAAVVAGDRPASLLAHRSRLYPWPYPFAAAEPGTPGAAALDRPDGELASSVDHVVVPADRASEPPEGFVLEAWGPSHAAFVRSAVEVPIRTC